MFAGPGATAPPIEVQFSNNNDSIFYGWNLTVPAGGTVIVMHFAVQRGVADTAGAQSQAEALVDLSDPRALVGMTQTERSLVVNFSVPPQ